MIFPKCKAENDDNWPISVDGEIVDGGCQECWESESSESWGDVVVALADTVKPETFQYVQDHIHRYRVRQKNGEYSKFFDDFELWLFINEEIKEHYALRDMNEC